MKIQAVDGALTPCCVWPDTSVGPMRRAPPLAGPFPSGAAARLWILEHLESCLSAEQRAVWATLMARLGHMTDDLGLELGLIALVAHGRTLEQCLPWVPAPHRLAPPDPSLDLWR